MDKKNPFTTPPDGVLDARGRLLQVGDEIILQTGQQQYLRVIDIQPNLDPRLPPGLFLISVGAAYSFHSPSGIPQVEFIRVRTAKEAGPTGMSPASNMAHILDPSQTAKGEGDS